MRIVYFIILFKFVYNYAKNQGLTNSLADMNNVLGAKNLLPNNAESLTYGGITFTVNSDGSVTANGTASENVWLLVSDNIKLDNIAYTLTGCPEGGGGGIYEIHIRSTESDSSQWQFFIDYGNGITFIADPNRNYNCYIEVAIGKTVSNLTFYPMLRPASIQDATYVPYSMTNREMTPYVQAISNPNLLDNPWFTINQRGITTNTQSEGTTRYTVDRWILRGAPTITVNTDSVVIDNTSGTEGHSFYQKIEEAIYNKIKGKTVTISIDAVASKTGCVFGTWQANQTPQARGYKAIPTTRSIVTSTFTLGDVTATSPFEILIDTVSGATLTIYSIKLELGSVSTLAMDTAPNYATELLKCQRYFVRIKKNGQWGANIIGSLFVDGIICDLNLASTMRANPTMSVISYGTIHTPSNDYVPTAIHVDNLIGNIVRFFASKPGWSFTNHTIANYEGVEFDLSADL